MSKSLIIVESPAKIKTLKNFLGADYLIEASMGHVRDLPKTKLGVDPDNNFEPEYLNIPDRKAVIAKLKKAAKEVETIYLASDPDREGEAIAWHLQEVLKAKNAKRIRFNEITSSAVTESLKHAQSLNMDLVNAQQARRVLDRLVGYKLSPLLWKKIKRNLSAGRVQSVAVRLICEREREITAFTPVEYWSIEADLTPTDKAHSFRAKLASCDGKKCEISNKEQADKILAALEGAKYKVESIKKTQKRRNAPVPFITSTLQQEASRKLNFGARKTMTVAQQLYEGVELGEKGSVGLITYMRTDSTRIAKEAQDEARNYIAANFGSEYAPTTARQVSKKGAQDAHEAIRPTSVFRNPDAIKEFLSYDQARLYKLIWQRFLASQMSPAVFDVVSVEISANKMTFRATGSTVKFAGFMKVYTEGKDEEKLKDEEELPPLPEMKEGELLKLLSLIPDQHFTEPPPRYSEATLVKALEENGIGRPSTYAAIISTIQDRKYVALELKRFHPTELGFIVNDQLVKHFPDIMNVEFTAGVESNLDKVEEGKLNWVKLLRDFYTPFDKDLQEASEKMERVKMQPKESDQMCPNCGKVLLIREGRFGEFLGCSGYPDCKTTMPLTKKLEIKCPICGDGDIVEKISKKKKVFYGCSKYPDCAFVTWLKPTNKKCPECDSLLGEKRFKGRLVGYGCTNTNCDYIKYRGKNSESEVENEEKPEVAELVKE